MVIVGAGLAGLFTAYWLARYTKKAKTTLKILVVDEAPHPAFKASGRVGGAVYLGSNKLPSNVAKMIGVEATKQLYRYSGENNRLLFNLIAQGMSCDLESNGGLRMSTSAKESVDLDQSYEFLQSKLDITAARFDNKQAQHLAIMPLVDGALWVPFEGMLDPFALCNNLARLLRNAAGVRIVYGASVMNTGTNKNGPYIELSNGHTINARGIVHATTKIFDWKELSKHIVYKREHIVRTSPFGQDLDDMALPMMPIEIATDSFRMSDRSLIMTGGKSGMKKDTEIDVTNDSDFNKRIFEHLNFDMLRHFPFTNLLELTHVWTLVETGTDDLLPIMGQLEEGHYANVAHGRNKLGLSFLGAKNVAESILGLNIVNKEFSIFSPSRFLRGQNV